MRTHLVVLFTFTTAAAACGSSVDVPRTNSDGGAGGFVVSSSSPASTTGSASNTTSSSSGDTADAGSDGQPDEDGSACVTCAEVLTPPHPLGPLCPGVFGILDAYLACGCVSPCGGVCKGSPWCDGLYPVITSWSDPTGACLSCLTTPKGGGCADQAATCAKN